MIVTILFAVCLIIVGAVIGKPTGWVVLALALLALLLALDGGHFHVG